MKAPLLTLVLLAACAHHMDAKPSTSAVLEAAEAVVVSARGAQKAPEPPTGPKLDLLPGTNCSSAALPSWSYDPSGQVVRLSDADFSIQLPARWKVAQDRPDLIVVSAPESEKGVLPVFELFVSPVCERYEGPVVHERIAARGLMELLPADKTKEQVARGSWSGGLGGPVGQSIFLNDVVITTSAGTRTLALYETEVGHTETVGIHASAVCPSGKKPAIFGPCEETYFKMLESGK